MVLYCPIRLEILENKILSYRIGPNETFVDFISKINRHLTLCSKRFDVSERNSYIEKHAVRMIKTHMPSEVLKIVEEREELFTPYNSSELLGIYLQYNS